MIFQFYSIKTQHSNKIVLFKFNDSFLISQTLPNNPSFLPNSIPNISLDQFDEFLKNLRITSTTFDTSVLELFRRNSKESNQRKHRKLLIRKHFKKRTKTKIMLYKTKKLKCYISHIFK